MPLASRQAHELEMAHSTANDAMRAVAMQRQRIARDLREDDVFFAGKGFRQEVDIYFLLLALRWLHESCSLAADLTEDPSLLTAIADFERTAPQARDMRDVREHVSDYIRGDGKLQGRKTTPDRRVHGETLGLRMWFGQDRRSIFWWAGKEIALDAVVPSAERLYASLREAMARCGSA